MSVAHSSDVAGSGFTLDLDPEHPIMVLFARFPWLGMAPDVCEFLRLMMSAFGDRLATKETTACKAASEALSAAEIRQLRSSFARRCPVDVTGWNPELGRRWSQNLPKLYLRAIAAIRHADPARSAEARHALLIVFCQLLLAIGLSPTAP